MESPALGAKPVILTSGLSGLLARRPVILQLAKFVCIGLLNTAIDFILLNLLSVWLGIDAGTKLGLLNFATFGAATLQSYFWNRAWAFASGPVDLLKNFLRLVVVGGIGFVGLVLSLVFAWQGASLLPFVVLAVSFLLAELAAWKSFNLEWNSQQATVTFAVFLAVSIVGLLINSGIVAQLSGYLHSFGGVLGSDAGAKNVAKIFATGASLVWNFLGYKFIVFRK